MPSEASRISDQVARLDSTSTSPVCSAVKRCCAERGTYLTLLASPITAAAIALQMSTSKPDQRPWVSGNDQPETPVDTPHAITPLRLIASTVGPAPALSARHSQPNVAIPSNPIPRVDRMAFSQIATPPPQL